MKHLLYSLFLCFSGALSAQTGGTPFTLYLHDTTGKLPDTPLPASYQVASAQVGGSSATVIKMVNTSANTVYFAAAVVSTANGSTANDVNFSTTGVFQDQTLVPNASVLFTVNFTPTAIGLFTGYLNLAYQVQQNGCVFSGSSGTICPANVTTVSTLNGTGTAPLILLSYQSASGPVLLTPSSNSPLNFPDTSLTSTSTITFILTNPTTMDAPAPAISIQLASTTGVSAFSLNTSAVPVTILAGGTAQFTVTFAPSQAGLASAELEVGSNSYPIQGAGIIVATIDALDIFYTNSTGIRTLPQAATPISFGQIVPGSGATATLTFYVWNPSTSANAVTIPAITLTGNGFSAGGLPSAPVTLTPSTTVGDSGPCVSPSCLSFTLTFAPSAVGSYTGSLAIGSRSFSLAGVSVASAIPGLSINVNGTVASQQQLTLTVQTSAPSPVSALGTLSMTFTPTVPTVTDDSAVIFLATGGRQLNISLAAGAQQATYNSQSGIAFQTGTTAGTITFSVAFPATTTYTQQFSVPAASPQLTTVQATRESPNLLVTLNGYDNTYTAGALSFTFYDTSGKVIGNPISVDATSDFKQLFFTNNTYGGLFELQASFPVTGDVTKVGSVAVTLGNSAGQTSSNAAFQ